MPGLIITATDVVDLSPHYPAPCVVEGHFSCRHLSPPDWPLWGLAAQFAAESTLRWDATHGDEVIYLAKGQVRTGGHTCSPEGVVIVEAGVPAVVHVEEPSELLHFGSRGQKPPMDGHFGPSLPGCQVHVVGPGAVFASRTDTEETRIYADSTCPTCRPTLFYIKRNEEYVSGGHSHSQNELVHVLDGELHVGRRSIGVGETMAIEADFRYAFRAGPQGITFLNYRNDVSRQSIKRGDEPILEGGNAAGIPHVGDEVLIVARQE